MEIWRNGEKAGKVREIINRNFNILERYLPNSILALSTEKRLLLSSDYLRSGLIVFDTDFESWFKYNGQSWEDYDFPNTSNTNMNYVKIISVSDWDSTKSISIPFSEHSIPNPTVHLYILYNDIYEPVNGGYGIDDDFNIILSTDLVYDGKVVVK